MIFVSATDTNVGKTFFSCHLINYLIDNEIFSTSDIAYYKPVQCGQPTDKAVIERHCPNVATYNSYDLQTASSPHYAAQVENIIIDLNKIKEDFALIKVKHKFIIVEGAGGLAVPLNDKEVVADIARRLELPLVLVTRKDLGTINHTLLSVKYAKDLGINIKGLFFVNLINQNFDQKIVINTIQTIEQLTGLTRLNYEDIHG